MSDFRLGYLYALAPIHCGGEGDIGNILEIAREVHTDFPYVPGSSLRGSLRNELALFAGEETADLLFGKKLDGAGEMGVHQVWFGDARILWIPMRTMSFEDGTNVFAWVSCPTLLRNHAALAKKKAVEFPDYPVGTRAGHYSVADAEINVSAFSEVEGLEEAIKLSGSWPNALSAVKSSWEKHCLILPDADFHILMEHSLWTQVRNKIKEEKNGQSDKEEDDDTQAGSAEIFWTDVCLPRDTILYYSWGYNLSLSDKYAVTQGQNEQLLEILKGLIQVGGQANIGRGWVQSWVADEGKPKGIRDDEVDSTQASESETAETPSPEVDKEPETTKSTQVGVEASTNG